MQPWVCSPLLQHCQACQPLLRVAPSPPHWLLRARLHSSPQLSQGAHQSQCPPPSKTCFCIIAPIGSPRPGEPCFSLPSTLQAYRSGQRRFSRFCSDARLQPLPLTETLLSLFVSHLAAVGLAHQTIKSYLSAVRYFHISAGYGDPFPPGAFPLLQYILRGIKRSPRPPSRPRLPITPSVLRSMKSS